jgi:hypothetical protein
MTGFAWLQKNDPEGYREKQPNPREVLVNPRALVELLGSVGVTKEYGVHRQNVTEEVWDEVRR